MGCWDGVIPTTLKMVGKIVAVAVVENEMLVEEETIKEEIKKLEE